MKRVPAVPYASPAPPYEADAASLVIHRDDGNRSAFAAAMMRATGDTAHQQH
jgi:hypothetical protein